MAKRKSASSRKTRTRKTTRIRSHVVDFEFAPPDANTLISNAIRGGGLGDIIRLTCDAAVGQDRVRDLVTELAVSILRTSSNPLQDGPDVNLLRWVAAKMKDNRNIQRNVAVMPPVMEHPDSGDFGE